MSPSLDDDMSLTASVDLGLYEYNLRDFVWNNSSLITLNKENPPLEVDDWMKMEYINPFKNKVKITIMYFDKYDFLGWVDCNIV